MGRARSGNSFAARIYLTSGACPDMLIGFPIGSVRVPDQSGVECLWQIAW